MDVSKLLLHTFFLIFLGPCNGSGSKHHQHNPNSNIEIQQVGSHYVDPQDMIFFRLDDLKEGNKIPLYFPQKDLSDTFAHLLSKEESDSIPFSSQDLPDLLRFFSYPEGSLHAKTMQDTLESCEKEPPKTEKMKCATTMESMVDFVQTMLSQETKPLYFATYHSSKFHALLQNYTVMGFKRVPTSKRVACHPVPYPYTVFGCHQQTTEGRVYKVSLIGDDGDEVDTVAVCHMDTSHWTHEHVSFKVLGTEPGLNSPVCHFFVEGNLVWVPQSAVNAM